MSGFARYVTGAAAAARGALCRDGMWRPAITGTGLGADEVETMFAIVDQRRVRILGLGAVAEPRRWVDGAGGANDGW